MPSDKNGSAFASVEALLDALCNESSGHYLVGSQGMWHGGIHITDATAPWCALSSDTGPEQAYPGGPYRGEQFIRCMADGDIVAYRVCRDYPSMAIKWLGGTLCFSNSFVLVKHYIKTADSNEAVGLMFYTLYMNLAPFSAYAPQDNALVRQTKGAQRYYATEEDVQANHAAGTLTKNTRVALGDNLVTRAHDRRQFTQVTLTEETKNAAGTALAAGTRVWTVSDRGALESASGIPVPPWWAACSPAYGSASPSGVVEARTRTDWAYYLSSADVLQKQSEGRLAADFPLSYEPGNVAQQVERASDRRTFSLVTLGRDVGRQKRGDRVWVVSDGDSLTPLAPAASGSEPVLGEVVIPPSPIPVSAGDGLGHLGFFELPVENGKRARYQVHIECLSMDETLPKFLTNPGKAGEQTPAFLKYAPGAPLFMKNAQGEMVAAGERKTRSRGILTLSKVPVVEAEGAPAYYQIRPEGGWLAAADVQRISQYALAERGFVTLDKAPVSFDLIDGVKHPDNVVKGILTQMYQAAKEEKRTSHALNAFNYQRLLEQIDRNRDGMYSQDEYLDAVHNRSYRDALYRIIARHGSEWYYGKDDPLWKNYLEPLTKNDPLWKNYTEAFIEKMIWMKAVEGMGPKPWHMHPVVFLEAMNISLELINIDAFLNEYKKQHSSFAPGTPALTQGSKRNLEKLISNINTLYSQKSEYKPNLYRLSYMLATARHETYHFPSGEYFSELPEVGAVNYFNKYDPVLAETEAAKNRALENGNILQGDGFKYRGRGCVHLTWKNNYQKAKDKYNVDFINQPELAGDFKYAVPIMVWGMEEGIFTGKKLSTYINNVSIDYEGARKIINGNDQKILIASYAKKFQDILEKTSTVPKEF